MYSIPVHQLIWYNPLLLTRVGLAMSQMISHAVRLTPLDRRLSPIMHHTQAPGSELIKVVEKKGRWDAKKKE